VLISSGDSFPNLIQKRSSQLGFVTYLLNYPRTKAHDKYSTAIFSEAVISNPKTETVAFRNIGIQLKECIHLSFFGRGLALKTPAKCENPRIINRPPENDVLVQSTVYFKITVFRHVILRTLLLLRFLPS
jgi:hypothetical protein